MKTRTAKMLVLLGVLAVAYVWMVLWPDRAELQMVVVQRPPEPPSFVFSRETVLRDVQLVTDEPVSMDDPTGDTFERVIWHMVPRNNDSDDEAQGSRPRKHVTYGRRIRGMEPAEGFRGRGEPLKSKVTYRFIADTTDGVARAEFTAR